VSSSRNGLPSVGDSVTVAIRPEQIALWGSPPEGRGNIVQATLQAALFLGDRYEYTVTLGSESRVLVSPASQALKAGDKVFLELKSEGLSLWQRQA
jgi:ABC-type Fe3+/spermidine/putrescine transport system ATPase subunit